MSSIFRADTNGASVAFDFAAMTFGGQSFLLGGRRRPGTSPLAGFFRSLSDHGDHPFKRVFAIAFLAAVPPGLDDQHAIRRHAAAGDMF